MNRAALALVVVYAVLLSSSIRAQNSKPLEIMPLNQIHAGMRGVAYTVFQGTKPEPMDVEVLGVLKNANGPKGDLYVNVRVKPHKKFTCEGDLILSEEHVGMVEAALGTEINVDTVDGPIRMKVPAGTQSGSDFKLSEHGVPHLRGGSRGAHIVTVVVDTPTKLTREQQTLLQQFAATGGDAKKKFCSNDVIPQYESYYRRILEQSSVASA